MTRGKKVFDYVKYYAETKGIISLDVGTIQEDCGTWKIVQSFCDSRVAWLHSLVSERFMEKFMGKQPINYLYDFWKNSSKDDEIIIYPFSKDGFVNERQKESIVREESGKMFNNYNLAELSDVDDNSSIDTVAKDRVSNLLGEIIGQQAPVIEQLNNEEYFKKYQGIFTKLILTSFNSILSSVESIKYVTIVLLRKKYDGKWHLSYNSAIFSNNLSYLDNPSIKLLFDCISHENYDNEIAALKQNIRQESIKSAMAAIMARNMSHNLGSHFLTNTKNYFAQQVRALEGLKQTGESSVGIDSVAKDFRGNVAMLQYLQERMDFIATVISGDKYPFGSLNFKSQLYDILTEDDHGARHGKETQNFLLKYLVFSEKLTRGNEQLANGFNKIKLKVEYRDRNHNSYYIFTGEESRQQKEDDAKLTLSKLNLAVPGGLMARHAFFSIFENVIRNSAKHSKKDSDLEITIRLTLRESNLNIKIFDNRQDRNAKDIIENHFRKLCIVDENNALNKESKGLKEILICILWLKNTEVAEVLTKIQSLESSEERLKKIEEYLKIENINNNLCYSFNLPIFTPYLILKPDEHYKLNNDNRVEFVNDNQILKDYHSDVVLADCDYELSTDKESEAVSLYRKLSDIFPRFVKGNKVDDEVQLLRQIHPEYFEKIISVNSTKFGDQQVKENGKVVVTKSSVDDNEWDILFYDHFHTKKLEEKLQILSNANGKYIESVSGENFTSTITTKDFLEDPVARYKTVEAALSKITIIDERIFGDYKQRQDAIAPSFTNKDIEIPDWWNESEGFEKLYDTVVYDKWSIVPKEIQERVKQSKSLNELKQLLFPPKQIPTEYGELSNEQIKKAAKLEQSILESRNIFLYDFKEQFDGFVDLSNTDVVSIEENSREDSFLSIHLGMIEKYKDNYKRTNLERFKSENHNKKEDEIDKALTKEALSKCMELIKGTFHPKFISVHSGRGNYSADLSEGLKDYPFISLSALEAALYNCKYFLSELFHNTNYYGKGNLNNQQGVQRQENQ